MLDIFGLGCVSIQMMVADIKTGNNVTGGGGGGGGGRGGGG